MIPPLGVITTGAEFLFGLLLLVGWHTRVTALLSGLLLMLFGLAMTLVLGVEAPLNFSVFPAAGGALFLAHSERFPFSVDDLLFRRCRTGQRLPTLSINARSQERRIYFKEMRRKQHESCNSVHRT